MRRSLIFLLLLKIVLAPLTRCFADSDSDSASAIAETSLSYPNPSKISNPFNSLLPATPKNDVDVDVALVIDLDGNVYILDNSSRKLLSSWSSGFPIYSSYQNLTENWSVSSKSNASQPSTEFFVDVGDDWQLYKHTPNKIEKMSENIEEYVRGTPRVSRDGGVTLGSRRSTVYLVDASSGKLIHTYELADAPSISGIQNGVENQVLLKEDIEELLPSRPEDSETVEQLLYIKRTDYALQHQSPVTGKVVWNVAFSDFDAFYNFPNSGNELGGNYKGNPNSPLAHEIKLRIIRIRDPVITESLSIFDRRFTGFPSSRVPLPKPEDRIVPVALGQIPVASKITRGGQVLALPSSDAEKFGIVGIRGSGVTEIVFMSILAEIIAKFHLQYVITFMPTILFVLGFMLYRYVRKQSQLNKVDEELKVQVGVPKKKKTRRLGNRKNNANNEKSPKYSSDDYGVNGLPYVEGSGKKSQLTFTDTVDDRVNGRRIGKLIVSSKEIAKGSNGTVVLEGIYDGRFVAVKRLVRTHHDVALKEIQNLIASDQHPNVVRWYGVEHDQDFVYISLERCTCSLNDLIYLCSESFQSQVTVKDQHSESLDEYTLRLYTIWENNKDIQLWKVNGYPTPQSLKLMRDVVSGIAHLHELGIIHRDLKPQNVLINKDRFLSAKLSDMGISKRLPGDRSSITQHATGFGSSGWQAPEQLLNQRQTRAVDLFSLGCLLFFFVTGGKHPFGDSFERDVNIVNDRKDFFLVENMPEALDLFTRLLNPNPDLRPKAMDVLHHPFFWSSEMRLSFLRDASDRVELEDREKESQLLNALESIAPVALNGKWDEKLETAFIDNIGRYRRYKYDCVRDLLRVIRNKLNHYRELPQEIQELLGPVPEGFDGYFSSRFPRLLIEVYKVMDTHCMDEEFFLKYITSNLF